MKGWNIKGHTNTNRTVIMVMVTNEVISFVTVCPLIFSVFI